MGRCILFVGKSDSILDPIWPRLEARGLRVSLATSQRMAVEQARKRLPDLIIIDGAASHSVQRLSRSLHRIAPHSAFLLLADEHGMPDDVECDMSLPKPFTARKLIARVEKLLEQHAPRVLQVGTLRLDPATRIVHGEQGEQHLTPKECAILVFLIEHAGQVVSRQQLMQAIWDTSYLGDTRTLDVHIRWLRKKVERDPNAPLHIITVRGEGYRFDLLPTDNQQSDDDSPPP